MLVRPQRGWTHSLFGGAAAPNRSFFLPFRDKEGREEGEWREGGSKIVNQKDQTKISLHACYSLFRKCKLYTIIVIQPMEH